jgi:hypothetical protein
MRQAFCWRKSLENVMQAELDLTRRRAYAADPAKTALRGDGRIIIQVVVRIRVAGNIENVKKISAEADEL